MKLEKVQQMAGKAGQMKGQAKVVVGDLTTTKGLKAGRPVGEINRVIADLARSVGLAPCRADAVRGTQCAS